MLLVIYASLVIIARICCGLELIEIKEEVSKEDKMSISTNFYDFDMETVIRKVEDLALIAQKNINMGVIPQEETENVYNRMLAVIEDLTKAIKHSDNVYKFIKAKGLSRILSNNLTNTHSKLRTKLLLLLKEIFVMAPTTTNALLPLNIIDKLLDIFENDNLALKAHALDILYKWLPNNPKAQVRVMKTKGLETFYGQMNKLDVGVIQTLMELFNKILKEHLDARNDKVQITKDDGEKLVMYQRIGLLERMSTPNLCNGLLNIFEMLWSYNNTESDNIKIVLELVKNVKPFCLDIYSKKPKALNLFNALLKYVKDEDRKEYFENHDVNVTELINVIEEYLSQQDHAIRKDEF